MPSHLQRSNSLQRLQSIALKREVRRKKSRANLEQLISYPAFLLWGISLVGIPFISVISVIREGWFWASLALNLTLLFQLCRGLIRMHAGQSPLKSAFERRGLWLSLFLWILLDIDLLHFNAQIISLKIGLVGLFVGIHRYGVQNRLKIATHDESLRTASIKLRDILGIMTGFLSLLVWTLEPELSITGQLGLLMAQSAPLLHIIVTPSRWYSLKKSSFKLQVFTALSLPIVTGYLFYFDANPAMGVSPFFASLALILVNLAHGWHLLKLSSWEQGLITPWRALSASILSLCMVGTGLLMLPTVQLSGRGLTLLEASFTAVSASCITGLSIVDLSQLNILGQIITLSLIQVGGFGIILLTHMLLSVSTSQYSSRFKHLAHEAMGGHFSMQLEAQKLFVFVLAVEGVSALVLTGLFIAEGTDPFRALWLGIFTSISAFCNAGFALQSDSFVSFAQSQPLLYVISLTVILGGIGPKVIEELSHIARCRWLGERPPQLSLYSLTILWCSAFLILFPMIFFCWHEWTGALSHLEPAEKIANSFFHSTSLRTAGFNSFDLSKMSDASWSLSLGMMIIGGSPFSTAGGIKVTTFALLFISLLPTLRGERGAVIFNRAQPLIQSSKAMAILILSGLIISLMTFALQTLGEPVSLRDMIFEVVSALGTVGLSLGATSQLSAVGLYLIMLCMFLGRIGPPALLLSLTQRRSSTTSQHVGEELPL